MRNAVRKVFAMDMRCDGDKGDGLKWQARSARYEGDDGFRPHGSKGGRPTICKASYKSSAIDR